MQFTNFLCYFIKYTDVDIDDCPNGHDMKMDLCDDMSVNKSPKYHDGKENVSDGLSYGKEDEVAESGEITDHDYCHKDLIKNKPYDENKVNTFR